MSDEQWALIEPVITAWKAAHPSVKRGPAVDTFGPVIAAVGLAASAHENTAGSALLDRIAATRICRPRTP
ncbi:hypothetical protein [Streptosporangium sp. LJ11]|uniref:hypothetical protein n=1 Tax=Streptosporangium sp. LJ11 TaxID=3436927 RepID=UPI003F78DF19